MNPRSLAALSAASLLALSGCNKEKSPSVALQAPSACAADLAPTQVVATVGDQKVTLGEVEKEFSKQFQKLEADYKKQRFDFRRTAVEQFVLKKVVRDAALKAGFKDEGEKKAEDLFLDKEIESKLPQPSDADLEQAFETVKDQVPPGVTLEMVKPQLARMIRGQKGQELMTELFERLKKEAGVKVMLEEPRKQVEAVGPSRGPADAKVTIVEYSDFECPYCAKARTNVDKVMEANAGKVRLVFRHFPLPMHKNAPKAAEAAACADAQGKFFAMHDQLFDHARELEADKLPGYAEAVGLDMAKFNACLQSGEMAKVVERDGAAAEALGVSSTPTFFINGRELAGALPPEEFQRIIDEELANAK
jgi:protein-disulfide isomerase